MEVFPSAAAERPPSTAPPFAQLYGEQKRFVWRLLLRLGVPRADAPDAAQEVFLVAHRKLGTFNGTSTVRTWLFGLTRRVAADFRKRAHVRRETVTSTVPEQASAAGQGEALEQRQARQLLEQALDQFSEEQRAIFVLYELEEWSMTEIAEAVGCPLQTAYSRLHAARKVLDQVAVSLRRPWDVP